MIETFSIFRSGVKRKTESQVTENFFFFIAFLAGFTRSARFFYVLRLLIFGYWHHFAESLGSTPVSLQTCE